MCVKQWCGRVRDGFLSKRDEYRFGVMTLVCLLLLVRTFTNLMYASDALYQTWKDFAYYKGVALFLVVVMLVRRVAVLNVPVLATAAVYIGASVKHFLAAGYESELRNAMLAKCVAWGLFLIILVDVIRTGNRTRINRASKVISGVTLLAFTCAMAMNFQYSLCVFFPLAAFYLTPISKRQWIWFMDCLTTAYYGAFAWVMTKSLIVVPYDAKYTLGGEDSLYYFGTFTTPWIIGIFCAGAFVCAVYWFVKVWTAEKRNPVKVGTCVAAMAYPLYATLIISSRSAELGILTCAMVAVVFVLPTRPGAWKKRALALSAAVAVGALCAVFFLKSLVNVDLESLESVNGMLGKHFLRYAGVVQRIVEEKPLYGVFFQNPVLTALDELMSNRLSILVQALKEVSPFGNASLSVVIGDVDFANPHNTYVSWLMLYGWVGGIPMIGWFFGFLVKSAAGVLKKDPTYLFPFLWGAFLLFATLFETMGWMYPAAFILLLVQYPLLVERSEG